MHLTQTILSLPDGTRATLTLAEPVAPEAQPASDAGAIEYDSWANAGTLEYDSWRNAR